MKKSGLVIASYDSTIALEAITANYPCVLFIDERYWELSEKAKPIFAKLESCGVLIRDPVVLAEFVVQYFGSYRMWWDSDDVSLLYGLTFINLLGHRSIGSLFGCLN